MPTPGPPPERQSNASKSTWCHSIQALIDLGYSSLSQRRTESGTRADYDEAANIGEIVH